MAVGIQLFFLKQLQGFPERVSLADAPIRDPGPWSWTVATRENLPKSFFWKPGELNCGCRLIVLSLRGEIYVLW